MFASARAPYAIGGSGLLGLRPRVPSAAETKQVGISICAAQEIVPDDFGGDEAEGDAIPPVTQRKKGVRKPGMDANVS